MATCYDSDVSDVIAPHISHEDSLTCVADLKRQFVKLVSQNGFHIVAVFFIIAFLLNIVIL